jgi:threonine/homoserine/homoserine lactone efflux protein
MTVERISIAFPILAAIVGMLAAIPLGPVNLEIIRRVLNRHPFSAVTFASGAAVADGLWPLVSFLGFAPLLNIRWVAALFWGFACLLLLFLGVSFIRDAHAHHHILAPPVQAQKQHLAFFGGFVLVISNPTSLITWITVIGIFDHLGILPDSSHFAAFVLWLSVAFGTLAYFCAIILLVNRHHQLLVTPKRLRLIKTVFGFIILAVAIYFGYHFCRLFIV